jgi:hypothetical protein
MSFDARGQLGKTLIFAKHGQTNYSKSYAVPTNPKSAAQTVQRVMVAAITKQWASLSAPYQASWLPLATSRQSTPYHAYLWYNLDRWRRRLLPVPTPTTTPSLQVYGYQTLEITGPDPNYAVNIMGDEEFKTAYIALLGASTTEPVPDEFCYLVATLRNPDVDELGYEFNATWTPPVAGGWYFATMIGFEDGTFTQWEASI